MATRPTKYTRWATAGVRTEPTDPKKDSGHLDGEVADQAEFNWNMHNDYLWQNYLDERAGPMSRGNVNRGEGLEFAVTAGRTVTLSAGTYVIDGVYYEVTDAILAAEGIDSREYTADRDTFIYYRPSTQDFGFDTRVNGAAAPPPATGWYHVGMISCDATDATIAEQAYYVPGTIPSGTSLSQRFAIEADTDDVMLTLARIGAGNATMDFRTETELRAQFVAADGSFTLKTWDNGSLTLNSIVVDTTSGNVSIPSLTGTVARFDTERVGLANDHVEASQTNGSVRWTCVSGGSPTDESFRVDLATANARFKALGFELLDEGNGSTSRTLDFSDSQYIELRMTGDVDITLSATYDGEYTLILEQDGTGGRLPTWDNGDVVHGSYKINTLPDQKTLVKVHKIGSTYTVEAKPIGLTIPQPIQAVVSDDLSGSISIAPKVGNCVFLIAAGGGPATPSGFTEIAVASQGSASIKIYYRNVTSMGAPPNITISGTSRAVAFEFEGHASIWSDGTATSSSSNSLTTSGASTDSAPRFVLGAAYSSNRTMTGRAWTNGLVEQGHVSIDAVGGLAWALTALTGDSDFQFSHGQSAGDLRVICQPFRLNPQ
ncbi:MAG: hypothetical protein B7733_05815 [Myxococcales bacterium FL481]|nr:MAG: hypothetical protein B7733_05815 [Myxococcales bacterium FL481]